MYFVVIKTHVFLVIYTTVFWIYIYIYYMLLIHQSTGVCNLQPHDYNFYDVFNSSRPRQSRRHFADDIFKCIFLHVNARISLKISLKFVPKIRINNIPALVQIMAWRRPGDKRLSEPMMASLLTHICVTGPQWVKVTFKPYGAGWLCTVLSFCICNLVTGHYNKDIVMLCYVMLCNQVSIHITKKL